MSSSGEVKVDRLEDEVKSVRVSYGWKRRKDEVIMRADPQP